MKIQVKRQIEIKLDTETYAKLYCVMEKICDLQEELYTKTLDEDRENTNYLNFMDLSQEIHDSIEKFLDCYDDNDDD